MLCIIISLCNEQPLINNNDSPIVDIIFDVGSAALFGVSRLDGNGVVIDRLGISHHLDDHYVKSHFRNSRCLIRRTNGGSEILCNNREGECPLFG